MNLQSRALIVKLGDELIIEFKKLMENLKNQATTDRQNGS